MNKRSKVIVMAVLAAVVVLTLGIGTVLAAGPQVGNTSNNGNQACSGNCNGNSAQCDGDCNGTECTGDCDGTCAGTCSGDCEQKCNTEKAATGKGGRGARNCGGSCGR